MTSKQPQLPPWAAEMASLLMGLAGLAVGLFLYTHGGQSIGSALIGAVSSAWFLHSASTKVTASLSASVDQALGTLLNNLVAGGNAASNVGSSTTTAKGSN